MEEKQGIWRATSTPSVGNSGGISIGRTLRMASVIRTTIRIQWSIAANVWKYRDLLPYHLLTFIAGLNVLLRRQCSADGTNSRRLTALPGGRPALSLAGSFLVLSV